MSSDQHLRVSKIQDGTVIDHIRAGQALKVLRILGIDGTNDEQVTVGMNVSSDRHGRKDIVKIEGRELNQDEVDVLSLIAPNATINIVRNYEVAEKRRVDRPEVVEGVLSCPNPNCITANDEPVSSRFEVLDDGMRCRYCEQIVSEDIPSLIDPE
ncbi:aspartate carbamoyltransferase regulatory subunit [Halobiforma haloterrestris]|uniref:Aspartate carbamoyltransferase regulatory chain n=1 Tax=Natronobacterium haloterrestre TaxID=148448 RepID=A0A1I1KWQ3_NATHA|nr:aspartate carbamoyltransferase regulatory subunit [Halobiforma haloterrestris]SFC61850.1 aspartate carbamoyltransferase regulatory subunit [Halobiforma haloterrestris]